MSLRELSLVRVAMEITHFLNPTESIPLNAHVAWLVTWHARG